MEACPARPFLWSNFPIAADRCLLRVADPRSGTRLCEAQLARSLERSGNYFGEPLLVAAHCRSMDTRPLALVPRKKPNPLVCFCNTAPLKDTVLTPASGVAEPLKVPLD